jgi:predicted RNA binding protein YcfA (HicA-like mRNA interferase family)
MQIPTRPGRLLRIGWTIKRQRGTSHRILAREGWPDFVLAFHDGEEIGPKMLARIAKRTGLEPEDLRPRAKYQSRLFPSGGLQERPQFFHQAGEPIER